MTTKERWTVYPLLLLAIGLALRGDVGDSAKIKDGTFTARALVCEELAILGSEADDDGTAPIIVHAGRVKDGDGGRIEIRDSRGVTSIAIGTTAAGRAGVVEFFDDQNRLVSMLNSPAQERPSEPEREGEPEPEGEPEREGGPEPDGRTE